MNILHPAAAVCAALILGACAIGKPMPETTTYIIEAKSPPSSTATRRPDTLRMGSVRVAAAFAGNSLVYRVGDVQYISDPYHAFIADPAAMFTERIVDWLDRAGPFKSVAPPGSTQSAQAAPYVLEAMVTELYGDAREGTPPAAVITVQFALVDITGARVVSAYGRTISRRVEIEHATADALVRGYGTALSEILSQVGSDLAALPVGQAAAQAQALVSRPGS